MATTSQSLNDSALHEIKAHYQSLALKIKGQNTLEYAHLSLVPQLLPQVNQWLDDPANVQEMLRQPSPRNEIPWPKKKKKKKTLKSIHSTKFDSLLEEKPKSLLFSDGEVVPRFSTNPRWRLSSDSRVTTFHFILSSLYLLAFFLGIIIFIHCLPPLILRGLVI